MKILFVSHENNLGGATRSMLGIIDELIKDKNNEILVFIPKFNEETKQGKLTTELEIRNIPYIYKRAYWWMYPKENKKRVMKRMVDYIKVFLTYLTSLKAAKIAKKRNIELVHSNSSVSFLGALVARRINSKHIWHIREFGREDHGLEFVLNHKKSIKLMKNNTDKFICISNSIYIKYSKLLGEDKCEMIFNGLDIKQKIKEPVYKADKAYNLLISGRIKESKGQLEAISAIKILRDKGYNNLTLYIAGICDDTYIEKLNLYIEDNKIIDNINFCGFVKDMTKFREKIDIELVCSKMEAFGRVTIEAMLNGNPVIGANTGGTKELIKNRATGLLYEQGNVNDLAKKIEELINDYELRKNIVEKSYSYAKSNFTSKINADRIIKEYRKILY